MRCLSCGNFFKGNEQIVWLGLSPYHKHCLRPR